MPFDINAAYARALHDQEVSSQKEPHTLMVSQLLRVFVSFFAMSRRHNTPSPPSSHSPT